MSSMEKPLRPLLQKYFDSYEPGQGEAELTLAQIEMAFIRAGWLHPEAVKILTSRPGL